MKTIRVTIKPNARTTSLALGEDGIWQASVREPAREGEANAALIALIAARFGVAKRDVRIKSGAASRCKLVEIDD